MARQKDIDLGDGMAARPGKKQKHLKPYTTLYDDSNTPVVKGLRKLAKDIESRKRRVTTAVVIISDQDQVDPAIHGYGAQSSFETMNLLLDHAKDWAVSCYRNGRKSALGVRE